MTDLTHYAVLGVKPDASQEDIKRAYRKSARHLHPDTNGGVELPMYLLVAEAYETLSDPARRAEYDRSLRQSVPSAGRPPRGGEDPSTSSGGRWNAGVPTEGPVPAFAPAPEGGMRFTNPSVAPLWLRRATWAALPVALVLFALAVPDVGSPARSASVLAVVMTVVSVLVVLSRRQRLPRKVLAVAVTVALTAWAASQMPSVAPYLALVVPAAALLGASVVSLQAWSRVHRGTRTSMRGKDAGKFFSWGTPGGLQATLGQYAPGLGRGGAPAHEETARLLAESLGDLPGARVFHAVHLPVEPAEIADHVVVCGSKVAVLTSLQTPDASVRWGSRDLLVTDGGDVHRASPTGAWVFSRTIPHMSAAGWVVVHRDSPARGDVAVSNTRAPEGVRAGGPERVMAELREWLLTDNDARVVDLTVLRAMRERVVSA